MQRLFLAAVLSLATGAPGGAMALPPLRENDAINDQLIAIAIAISLSDRCEGIAPRRLRGLMRLRGLERRALEEGYSQAQIDAYVDSEPDKDRLEARAWAYLDARDAGKNAPEAAVCAAGQAEIAGKSAAGSLMRRR